MKQALITGASSGIGLATAQILSQQGVSVTGIARNFPATSNAGITNCRIDLADLEQLPEQLKQEALQKDFDLLMLNAGYGRFGGLESFSYRQIQHMVNTNLVSNLFLLKYFLPQFKRQGGKDIVIIGSESALQGARQGTAYCATKFALRGLAQSLRADCASSDIRVILVNPGPVDSNFFDKLSFQPQAGEQFSMTPDSVAASILHALNQPRNVVLEEINLQPVKRAFSKK